MGRCRSIATKPAAAETASAARTTIGRISDVLRRSESVPEVPDAFRCVELVLFPQPKGNLGERMWRGGMDGSLRPLPHPSEFLRRSGELNVSKAACVVADLVSRETALPLSMIDILAEIIGAIGEAIFSWRFYLCFGLEAAVIVAIYALAPVSIWRLIASIAVGVLALGAAIVWEDRAS